MHRKTLLPVSGLLFLSALGGCHQQPPQAGPSQAAAIPVARPEKRDVTDYVDYTGRVAAVNAVDARARVTGYLVQAPFKEGAEVKKGDLLFEIDPRPYQAQVDAAKAQLALYEANYRLAQAELARSRRIGQRDPGAISREDLERYQAQEAQAQGSVGVAKANLQTAQLNLGWTKVNSPIDGQVSRYYYTLGNLITQDQTLLTTVMSVDPMYAYWDMDERTVLRVRTMINEGKIKPRLGTAQEIPVWMALEGETGYPHHGFVNFVNNQVNPYTGTIAVRGEFANPKPPNGRRLMTPGMFARVRLPIGEPHPALLVTDRAVGSDQGLKFVYVVDAQHKVQYRRVTTGPLEEDGLRVIEEGLQPDDWVVVGALQQVRPNMEVEPEELPEMPKYGTPATGKAPPAVSKGPQPPPSEANKAQPAPAGANNPPPAKANPNQR
jgi:multidrug efflux system membrane fusion protein